jgi:two-component system, LuxR family, sensor histidine kinase TtrS
MMTLRYSIIGLCITLLANSAFAQSSDRVARVGVLAFRGAPAAVERWSPLMDYLSTSVDGWRFEVVPVTLVSAPDKITDKQIDFLITNPGHYVTLAPQFGLSVLATRERRGVNHPDGLLTYGTVIFTAKTSGIRSLDDLKGKRLAAVSPHAFGGFQMAWFELQSQNIDPFTDFAAIKFMGFPQDNIVTTVLAGEVDAGVVRSGLLENMADEGRIDLANVTVLQGNQQLGYPFWVSGHLYPEWPFTALPGIDKRLREGVTRALLATQDNAISAPGVLADIWSAPLSYEDVRKLIRAYTERGAPDTVATGRSQNQFIVITALSLLVLIVLVITIGQMFRRVAQPRSDENHLVDPDEQAVIARFDSLTRREREILALICDGLPNKTIATDLGISPKTVEYHRANLLQKTEAGTSAHLVQLATRFGYDLGLSLGRSSQ